MLVGVPVGVCVGVCVGVLVGVAVAVGVSSGGVPVGVTVGVPVGVGNEKVSVHAGTAACEGGSVTGAACFNFCDVRKTMAPKPTVIIKSVIRYQYFFNAIRCLIHKFLIQS